MAIQNRRGNYADFDPFKMLPGEFGYILDTEELYYCVAPSNVKRVATKEDIVQILDTNQEAYDGLQQLLIELENETVASGILNDISDLLVKTAQHDGKIDSLENSVTINATNIAENTTNIAENKTNLDDHMLETAEDNVHGLTIQSGSASVAINNANEISCHIDFPRAFGKEPFVTAVATNIPAGYPFVLYRVADKTATGCNIVFRENTDRTMSGTLNIEWIAIEF